MSSIRPLLLLEINEIPWRLVDHLIQTGKYPNLEIFFRGSENFTTYTVDEGELSPWITWPTFHRGAPATEHGIRFLGQDPKTFHGTPIWEEYRRRGLSVGVCGSLQSWPPQDPGLGGFYIPDTFANDPTCFPKSIEPFQALNLRLTSENGRVVKAGIPVSQEAWRFAVALPTLGIRPKTITAILAQLVREKFDRSLVSRRPVFQAVMLWDIFCHLYKAKHPPAFASFFTNHVASAMHRYWHQIFPQDFASLPSEKKNSALQFAAKVFDRMLGDVIQMQKENPELVVVLASSMGQAAATWDRFEGLSTIIDDTAKLLASVGSSSALEFESLAMVPQVTVSIPEDGERQQIRQGLSQARTASGEELFFSDEMKSQLSISIRTPNRKDISAGGFKLQGKFVSWESAGIKVVEVEPGSAYHVPEGVLAILAKERPANNHRERISAASAKSLLMELGQLGTQITSK